MYRRFGSETVLLAAALAILTAGPGPTEARPTLNRAALLDVSRRAAQDLAARRSTLFHELQDAETGPQAALNAEPGLELMFVNDRSHPVFYAVKSLNAAQDIRTDYLWPGSPWPFNLDGSTTAPGELALWDYGSVRTTHQELTGRVNWADGSSYGPQDHSTLVGGIMASTGIYPQAKGMSFAAPLDSYEWTNDISEMATAAANGLMTSNHSYGFALGWRNVGGTWYWVGDLSISTMEDFYFGFYDSLSMNLDQIAVNAPNYTIVVAAGNDHGEGPTAGTGHYHWNGSAWVWATDVHDLDGGSNGYDCLDIVGTAKNVITIGAVHDLAGAYQWDAVFANFSNRGPTDDGRIKPDFVANGTTVTSAGGSADNVYVTADGTSMAAPSVAGTINLLRDYYESLHGGQSPLSSTMKALLVNTVAEIGPDYGPDYTGGWGMVDAGNAAIFLSNVVNNGTGSILEDTLENGETHVYWMHDVVGQGQITLAWTDPAGAPPPYSLNPTTAMLVNDLDLRAIESPDEHVYYPYVLDPANPSAPATKGDNARDNVEKIDQYFGYWTRVEVSHKGTLAAPQPYSLVSSVPLYREQPLTEVTEDLLSSPAEGHVPSWIDFDGDGDDDLHLLGRDLNGPSSLYRNDGGSFVLVDDDVAGTGFNISWADYDDDGDLDYYASGLYRNDGDGTFVAETNNPPYTPFSSSPRNADWADFDLDGDVDLYIVHYSHPNRLWRNDGDDGFTDVTPANLLEDVTANFRGTWIDFDEDGDPDLYVGKGYQDSKLYRNDGGTFVDVADAELRYSGPRDVDWGDYDGDLDLMVARWEGGLRLLRNDGGGDFVDVTSGALLSTESYMSVAWADLDLDGALDLFVGGGGAGGGNRVFLNQGGDAFVDGTSYFVADVLASVPGLSLTDWDADGDLDAVTVDTNDGVRLLRNDLPPGPSFLLAKLAGVVGSSQLRSGTASSNAAAIGAKVRVVADGAQQVRVLSAQSGRGRDSFALHFGMCEYAIADTVEVTWPTSGTVDVLTNVALNQVLSLTEGGSVTSAIEVPIFAGFHLGAAAPNPFRTATQLSFEIPRDESVRLSIYDVRGRRVRSLVDEPRSQGRHVVRWDGRDDRGAKATAGVYFYRLDTGTRHESHRVTLLR